MKENNGVTLIALAVTIIVMLIIAGVSLSSLNGQNSSIEQANDVKQAVEEKEERDAIMIAIQETLIASNNEVLELQKFEKYLKQHIEITECKYKVQYNDLKKYDIIKVKVKNSNRCYDIETNGDIIAEYLEK